MGAPKKNTLQFLLSYFFDSPVESRSSKYNPVLDVKYYEGGYILDADTTNFSFGALHRIFRIAFDQLHIDKRSIESALILGYGGGSVAQLLNERFNMPQIKGIEIDPEVIAIAKEYFDLELQDNVVIEETDASDYVMACKETYDLIVIDLFDDDKVPAKFYKEAFLKPLKSLLQPGGLLVFNAAIIDSGEPLKELGADFMKIYPDARTLSIDANKMLVWEDFTLR